MRVLLCTDGSPHGQAALRFGALIARSAGANRPRCWACGNMWWNGNACKIA